jgi:hypothetical protein
MESLIETAGFASLVNHRPFDAAPTIVAVANPFGTLRAIVCQSRAYRRARWQL